MENEVVNTEEVKQTKNKDSIKKLKKAGKIFIIGACLVATISAGYVAYNVKNAESALNVQNVQASDSSISEIEKKFGKTISGKYVNLLINFSQDYKGDVVKIGDTYISDSGEPFKNDLEGCDVKLTLSDGTLICVDNYDENAKIYADANDVIDPISKKELRENYELTFAEENGSYSYKLTQKK